MSKKSPKPVYVLHGQDDYLRRQYRRSIVAELVGEEDPQVAVSSFDSSADLSEVLDELRTSPLLASRRVAIVHDADDFITRHRAALEKYLAHPSTTASLILLVKSWRASDKLPRLAAEIGEVIDCSGPDEGSLRGWVLRMAKDRGKRISPEAAGLLAAWVGPDLGRLDAEIEKLALYVGRRGEISAEDAAAAVAATAGPAPYALTNAIGAGDRQAALDALGSLLTRRGEEFRVLGLIAWHLRRQLEGKTLRRPARGPLPRARSVRVHRDFRQVLQADLALKTGAEPLTTMQLLVVRLCRPAK